MTHQHLQLHKNYMKSYSMLLTQLYTRKIDFNQFLHERWVFDVVTIMCKCDKDQILIKHILLTCFKWKIEWKTMQCKKNIMNLRKLLEIMSATRSVVEFKLLNSTQVEFQNWVELREINSTQSSWVRFSTQLD